MKYLKRSPESIKIESVLSTMAKGQRIERSDMQGRCGFDAFSDEFFATMWRVRDKMLRASEGVFEIIAPRIAVRRLTDTEVVNLHATARLEKMRKCARRAERGNVSVEYGELSGSDQTKHNCQLAALGAIKVLGSRRAQKALAESNVAPRADPRDVLILFANK